MFCAYNKVPLFGEDKHTVWKVFGVRYSNGYPHFLIYHDNQWRTVSAKKFEPVGRPWERDTPDLINELYYRNDVESYTVKKRDEPFTLFVKGPATVLVVEGE